MLTRRATRYRVFLPLLRSSAYFCGASLRVDHGVGCSKSRYFKY